MSKYLALANENVKNAHSWIVLNHCTFFERISESQRDLKHIEYSSFIRNVFTNIV